MKKLLNLVICLFVVIVISGCGAKEEKFIDDLCSRYEKTREDYINLNININELISTLNEYNDECNDEELKTCKTLKSVVEGPLAINSNLKQELIVAQLKEVSVSCQLDMEQHK